MSDAATVARLDLWRYRVPLIPPAPLAERDGLLLEWRGGDGRHFFAEIAPLPGFSSEDVATCSAACQALFAAAPTPAGTARAEELFAYLAAAAAAAPPALRFGLESGRWLWQAHDRATSAATGSGGALPTRLVAPPRLTPCALYDPARTPNSPPAHTDSHCIKVKVGRGDLAAESAHIRYLDATLPPAIRLRLDANRSWSHRQAARFCAALDPGRIEYIEEPLLPGLSYAEWAATTPLPFAWDETVREQPAADLATPGLHTLVLKPMLTGLDATAEWLAAGRRRGLQVVISAAFESNLTLDLYARLIDAWSLPGAHGLDTFSAWPAALIEPLRSQTGHSAKPVVPLKALEPIARLL